MVLFSHFFISWQFSIKNLQFLRTCPFRFLSILSSKYVLFWNLVFKTILILIKFPFQWYINCRYLNFDATYDNGRHGDFPPFWKSGILGLVDNFWFASKFFWNLQGHLRNWNKNFLLTQILLRDSITGLGLYKALFLHSLYQVVITKFWSSPGTFRTCFRKKWHIIPSSMFFLAICMSFCNINTSFIKSLLPIIFISNISRI